MIDFFARRFHFIDHLAPIWRALPVEQRGAFYAPATLQTYADTLGIEIFPLKTQRSFAPLEVVPLGDAPILTCAYGDLCWALKGKRRKHILMEHGVGLTFQHAGYAGGKGKRTKVDFFLAPNEYIAAKTRSALPGAKQAVIGTPKLDAWGPHSLPFPQIQERNLGEGGKPVVCISFHWDGSAVAPEAGSAFEHYRGTLGSLAHESGFKLIGHGHPKAIEQFAKVYEALGIKVVYSFENVMRTADIYVCDCSSTLYEFCVTGKPVVLLNAPQFRKYVHFGLRFWDYTDIGPQVEGPDELTWAIELMLKSPELYAEARARAVADLYPYLGHSAARAVDVLTRFVNGEICNL
jgi:hypothetical protein